MGACWLGCRDNSGVNGYCAEEAEEEIKKKSPELFSLVVFMTQEELQEGNMGNLSGKNVILTTK